MHSQGKKVYEISELEGTYFYIVACQYETYPEIAEFLRNKGKREFVDFIYYGYINKKIVFLHGNCHMSVIQSYMESSEEFRHYFCFYHAPRLVNGQKFRTEREIFENISIYIHQDIRRDNKYGYWVSDEYIKSCIPTENDVLEIVVPNLYGLGKGFFPQNRGCDENDRNLPIYRGRNVDNNGMFPVPDFIIEELWRKGMLLSEVIKGCKCSNVFDTIEVQKSFDEMMERIQRREKKWDIKVSDFIIDNYQYVKLFYDAWHPTNFVMKYITEKVMSKLGITCAGIVSDVVMDTHEEPVYPQVAEILGLAWKDSGIRKSKTAKKVKENMDFDEYVREYIWWCDKKGELFEKKEKIEER